MDLRGLSPHTKSAYRLHIQHFSEHFGKLPEEMGDAEIRKYLHHGIAVRKLSSSYVIVCYSALKFFFVKTLGREWDPDILPRIKRRTKLPNILSKEELVRLFDATNNLKHRAALMTAYGSGLRVGELAQLKISDIDSKNMQVFIRQGKGQKDRFSLLSAANLTVLREYYRHYRPKSWLFPGQDPAKPIARYTLQMIFRDAKRKIGLEKNVSIHSLRHSFATHLLEDGVDVSYIQKLLGHKRVSTTCKYLHLTRLSLLNIKSPLDSMPGRSDG